MRDGQAVLGGEAPGDQRTMARLRIALDAQQRKRRLRGQRREVDVVEDLARVAPDVLGRQLNARALADPEPLVLAVLQLAQLGGRRQVDAVLVLDAGLRERILQAPGVGPRVLRPAHAAPLAHIDEAPDVALAQGGQERLGAEAVDADGGDGGQSGQSWQGTNAWRVQAREMPTHRGSGDPLRTLSAASRAIDRLTTPTAGAVA